MATEDDSIQSVVSAAIEFVHTGSRSNLESYSLSTLKRVDVQLDDQDRDADYRCAIKSLVAELENKDSKVPLSQSVKSHHSENPSSSKLEKLKFSIANHSVLAPVIIFGVIVIGIGSFTDALEKTIKFINAHVLVEDNKPRIPENIDISAMPETSKLFSDDFDTVNIGQMWQPLYGDWQIIDDTLVGEGSHPGWAVIVLDKQFKKNSVVTFRVRIIGGTTGELIFNLSNNKYVRVYIYSLSQEVTLGDGTFLEEDSEGGGVLSDLGENLGGGPTVAHKNFPIKRGEWYRITVEAVGNTFRVSVGGQRVVEFVDVTKLLSREGAIGFLTNGKAQFDDVIVFSRVSDSS